MVNFLSLLGWSPGDDREVLTRDELIARVHARRDQRRQRRLQRREARLVQPAAHRAAADRRPRVARGDRPPRCRPVEAGADGDRSASGSCACSRSSGRASGGWISSSRSCGRFWTSDGDATTRPRSAKHLATPEIRTRSPRSQRTLAGLEPFTQDALEAAVRALARGPRRQGRRPDSRHARGGHRPRGQPRTVRGAGAARAGPRQRTRLQRCPSTSSRSNAAFPFRLCPASPAGPRARLSKLFPKSGNSRRFRTAGPGLIEPSSAETCRVRQFLPCYTQVDARRRPMQLPISAAIPTFRHVAPQLHWYGLAGQPGSC